jgi:hypothetical protein
MIVPIEEIEKTIRESELVEAKGKKTVELARVVEVQDTAEPNRKEGGSLGSNSLETSEPIVVAN